MSSQAWSIGDGATLVGAVFYPLWSRFSLDQTLSYVVIGLAQFVTVITSYIIVMYFVSCGEGHEVHPGLIYAFNFD